MNSKNIIVCVVLIFFCANKFLSASQADVLFRDFLDTRRMSVLCCNLHRSNNINRWIPPYSFNPREDQCIEFCGTPADIVDTSYNTVCCIPRLIGFLVYSPCILREFLNYSDRELESERRSRNNQILNRILRLEDRIQLLESEHEILIQRLRECTILSEDIITDTTDARALTLVSASDISVTPAVPIASLIRFIQYEDDIYRG